MKDGDPPPLEQTADVHLHPRAVPVRHAFAWYEEAMRLWKRAPATWGVLAFVTLAVQYLMRRLPGAGSLLGQVVASLIGAGMIVASLAADRGERPRITHAVSALAAPAGAIVAIMLSSLATFVGEAVAAWWVADVNVLAVDADYELAFSTVFGVTALGVLVSLPFTFVPFHVLLEDARAGAAFRASFRGFALNTLPLIVYAGVSLVLLGFGLITSGLGLLIALPLWVTSSYAAWKDIFGVRVEAAEPAESV